MGEETERFDGWLVVAAVFVLFVTGAGLGFYGLSIYLEAITDERGFSTSSVSLATSMFFLISALVGRSIAGPVESGYTRHLVVTGALLCSLSLFLLGRVTAIWQLYAVYAVFAAGFALAGIIPGTTLVTRWFHARRSLALAVASTGLSFGGLTLTQLASWWIDRDGLRASTPWLALIFLVLAAASAIFMWPDPSVRGQHPDGVAPRAAVTPSADDATSDGTVAAGDATAAGADYHRAIGSRFFTTTTIGFFFAMAAQVGSIAHLANLGTDRVDRRTGALAVLALALASVMFRLLGGVVASRVPIINLVVFFAVFQGLSQIGLAESTSRPMLLASAFVMGATVGNLLMLQPLVMAEAFGIQAFARVFSLNQLLVTLGVATGPFLLGALEDGVSYRLSFWIAGTLSLLAAAVFIAGGPVSRAQDHLRSRATA